MWCGEVHAQDCSWEEFQQKGGSSRTSLFPSHIYFQSHRSIKLMSQFNVFSLKCRWQVWLQNSRVLKEVRGAAAVFHIFQTPMLPALERDLHEIHGLMVWEDKDINWRKGHKAALGSKWWVTGGHGNKDLYEARLCTMNVQLLHFSLSWKTWVWWGRRMDISGRQILGEDRHARGPSNSWRKCRIVSRARSKKIRCDTRESGRKECRFL